MRDLFLQRVEGWLPAVLHAKVVRSTSEDRLCFIGAGDVAAMLVDHVLTCLGNGGEFGEAGCGIDEVSDETLAQVTQLSGDVLAAGFLGAALELGVWCGPEAVAFMRRHGVPVDAAWAVATGAEAMSEKLEQRGQALLAALDARRAAAPRIEVAAHGRGF